MHFRPSEKVGDDDDRYISKEGEGEGLVMHLSASINDIPDWFKQFQVESIELWINGLMKSVGNTIGSECKGRRWIESGLKA